MFVLSFEYLFYDICNGNQREYHNTNMLFLLLSDASLYNHAICLQQTPVSSFLSMFANVTIPTVYVTCHINFLSNAILPALVYSTHSSVSSPNILIVYMIYQCSLYQISDAYSYFSLSSIAISSIRNLISFHLPSPLFYAPSAMCRSVDTCWTAKKLFHLYSIWRWMMTSRLCFNAAIAHILFSILPYLRHIHIISCKISWMIERVRVVNVRLPFSHRTSKSM